MARQVVTVVFIVDTDEDEVMEDLMQSVVNRCDNISGFDIIDVRDADADQ